MQSVFLSTAYANDSQQQVINTFYWSHVKVTTRRSCVKNVIHRGAGQIPPAQFCIGGYNPPPPPPPTLFYKVDKIPSANFPTRIKKKPPSISKTGHLGRIFGGSNFLH